MTPTENKDQHPQANVAAKLTTLGYVAAALVAAPVGTVAWFELVYLFFGLTGEDPPTAFTFTAAVLAYGLAIGWPLHGAHRPVEVVLRGCRLGLLLALLLPPVTFAVLLLWQNAPGRRDLGMGGLMLYSLPFVALGVAMVLGLVFGIGSRLAGRRLQDNSPVTER